jgi:hypothetical protein
LSCCTEQISQPSKRCVWSSLFPKNLRMDAWSIGLRRQKLSVRPRCARDSATTGSIGGDQVPQRSSASGCSLSARAALWRGQTGTLCVVQTSDACASPAVVVATRRCGVCRTLPAWALGQGARENLPTARLSTLWENGRSHSPAYPSPPIRRSHLCRVGLSPDRCTFGGDFRVPDTPLRPTLTRVSRLF